MRKGYGLNTSPTSATCKHTFALALFARSKVGLIRRDSARRSVYYKMYSTIEVAVMIDHPIVVLVTVALLSISMMGMAAAAPGEGPPSDMPDVVPDFVTDLLSGISEFVSGVLNAVGNLVGSLVPDAAAPSVGVSG